MTARYNHYPGENRFDPIPLEDNSKPCKAVIALGCPSNAIQKLADIWYDQMCAADELRRYNREWEQDVAASVAASGQRPESFLVKEFVKNTDFPSTVDAEPNCMLLTGPVMYVVPPQGTHGSAGNGTTPAPPTRDRMKRRRLNNDGKSVSTADEPSETEASRVATSNSTVDSSESTADAANTGGQQYPKGDQIFVGATYDPTLQLDYGGKAFQLVNLRLQQPDFRDVNQQLIPPWEFYDKLRPGTLVIANVDFTVYLMNGRKTYHANILSLRVLGKSDIPIEKPRIFLPPKSVASGPSAESFNNFEIPDFDAAQQSSGSLSSTKRFESLPTGSILPERAPEQDDGDGDVASTSPPVSQSDSSSDTIDGVGLLERNATPSAGTQDEDFKMLNEEPSGSSDDHFATRSKIFERKAYQFQYLYGRFFRSEDIISRFRRIQYDRGVLVSGSTVVAFMERIVYPESDLDLYTNTADVYVLVDFLEDIGYVFKPRNERNADLLSRLRSNPASRVSHDNSDFYLGNGIVAVFDFRQHDEVIQVIGTSHGPFGAILSFHSSELFSVPPFGSLKFKVPPRNSEYTPQEQDRITLALEKWRLRGWDPTLLPSAADFLRPSTEFCEGERCAGDKLSWVIPMEYMARRRNAISGGDNRCSDNLTLPTKWSSDPVGGNTWYQSVSLQDMFSMSFSNVSALHLRCFYTAKYLSRMVVRRRLNATSSEDPLRADNLYADFAFKVHGRRTTPVASDFHGDICHRLPRLKSSPGIQYSLLPDAHVVVCLSDIIRILTKVLQNIPPYSVEYETRALPTEGQPLAVFTIVTFTIDISLTYCPEEIINAMAPFAYTLSRVRLDVRFSHSRPWL
ncbi:hypothetical protein VKT23_014780 [Stygiomarasmius scandens]|uniref:Uncharacterized protein n=1 Tax=Marasmiellus scandens TaxID=2682957 RepID=A0ABR1IZN4_9AGAR